MKRIRIVGKLFLIGLITTIVRIIGQLLIPAGTQNVLKPSVFVNNGTMPLAFTLYGILAYTCIAAFFLLVKDKIAGNRVIRGLKYAGSCCLVWVVYLLEPLPHVALLDKFTYPIADSVALLVMGALAGFLFCEKEKKVSEEKFKINAFSTFIITLMFAIGRFIQYEAVGIYSSYGDSKMESLVWAVLVGFVLSIVLQWLKNKLFATKSFLQPILLGGVLFGVDLLLFNFFMPLVFDADISDLLIRTFVDIGFVILGCICMKKRNILYIISVLGVAVIAILVHAFMPSPGASFNYY